MPFFSAGDGTNLFYQDGGAGRPVVLLATACLDSRMWEFQFARLVEAGHCCIAYDRRGHGRSDQPWTGYDYDTLADDLAALLDRLDLREVTLVGYAMGGGEVVRYLSRHGAGRVASIALVASTTPYLSRTPDNPDGVDPAVLADMITGVTTDRPKYLADIAGPFFGGPGTAVADLPLSGELVHWLSEQSLWSSARAIVRCYQTLFHTDLRADVAAIDLPTVVVHGDADPFAPLALCGRRSADLIAGSELLVYPNASHGLFVTHADQLTEDLLAFLKD